MFLPKYILEAISGNTRAKKAYYDSTANHPTIHCNRFPLWEELDERSRQEWREKTL